MRSRRRPQQAGIARIDDFNSGDNAGVSYFDVNQRGGFRVSSAKAFLKPARCARQSHGVDARAHREAELEPRRRRRLRCTGATLIARRRTDDGARLARSASSAAGAIGTPQLLQLSGIGPASLLREHGIEVRARPARRGREPAGSPADPPGVQGERCAHAECRRGQFLGPLRIGLEYALRRTGP